MNGDGKESFHEREEGDGWFEVKTRFHEEVAAIVSSKPLCRSSPSSSLLPVSLCVGALRSARLWRNSRRDLYAAKSAIKDRIGRQSAYPTNQK